MRPARYFPSAAALRRWLESNHATATELLAGLYKKASGKCGLTYGAMLDELLCFGWIDGVKRRVDDERYTHRVSPRRRGSIWSNVNVRHAQRLIAAGRMSPAGLQAFHARTRKRTGVYSFERRARALPSALAGKFRAHRRAWEFWQDSPPGYRRTAIHWLTSARQPATRQRRLDKLIAASATGRRLF